MLNLVALILFTAMRKHDELEPGMSVFCTDGLSMDDARDEESEEETLRALQRILAFDPAQAAQSHQCRTGLA